MSMATTTFNDDNYTIDSSEYVDHGQTVLPLPGNYKFKVLSLGRRKDRGTGQPVLRAAHQKLDPSGEKKWPILMLNRVEIVEPFEEGGVFPIFQEVTTSPYLRRGFGGKDVVAANHLDLLRAIDAEAIDGLTLEQSIEEVEKLLASGQTFTGYVGYTATDTEWAKAQIAAQPGLDRDAVSKIWNEARLKTKDFRNSDGSYRQQTVGKSGKLIDAKITITSFVPSNRDVDLGASQN